MNNEGGDMGSGFLILVLGVALLMVGLMISIFVIFFRAWKRNVDSMMERARKIDPTVKTMAEADFVLKQELAKSVGTKKVLDNKDDDDDEDR